MSTSIATNTPQSTFSSTTATARALVIGLGWAAIMLFVIGSWMRSKYGDSAKAFTYIFLIAAAGAAALTAWQAFTLWFKKETPDEKLATLGQQRRLFSLIFIAAGLGLIGIAIVLGLGKKPGGTYGFMLDNLGESIGVLFFGLFALGAGYILSQGSGTGIETASPVQFLAQKIPLMKFAQLLLGVAALGGFIYLAYTNRAEQRYLNWLPELFALLALSILAIACFLWLNTGQLDDFGVRLFVLIFGGAFGLILFAYSLGRIVFWRQDIVFGGLVAWQGENAWHFWMCMYLQFAALVIMFASFNLARADIRTNVHLRRVMYGYDTIVQTLLLFEVLAVANIVLYALVPYTYDWTKSRGAYAISDSSKNLISTLKKETNIVVVMAPNDPVYRDVRNLMDNFQALSNKLKIQYISPDTDPDGFRSLARNFPKMQSDSPMASSKGVLLVNGPMPETDKHDISYAFVSDRKFTDNDLSAMREKGGKQKRLFKGEGEITKELKFLVQGKKRKVYVLQGNDEPDINLDDPSYIRPDFKDDLFKEGFGLFVEKLNKDNYEVVGVSFGKEFAIGKEPPNKIIYLKEEGAEKRKDFPIDCDTLIVTPAAKALHADVVAAIDRYMDVRNGKMLMLLDVIAENDYSKLKTSGLEPLLKRFGVEVVDGYALSTRGGRESASTVLASAALKSEHVLARQFLGRTIAMPDSSRVLKTVAAPGRFKAEPVLQLEHRPPSRFTVIETDIRTLQKDPNLHLRDLIVKGQIAPRISQEPATVAVAVSESEKDTPRMVVIGDTEFITNIQIARSDPRQTNYSFAVSALEWMAERESIGVQPKENLNFTIDQGVDGFRMVLLPGWIMFLMLVGLGMGIWVVRRR